MKRRNWSHLIAFFGLSLLVATLIFEPTVQAAEVWSDNFDDENYDGWTIKYGSFSCESKTLAATTDSTPEGNTSSFDNAIWRKSNVSYGTWSFDFYWGGQTYWGPTFFFVVDELRGNGIAPGGSSYALQLEKYGWLTTWDFMYIYGTGFDDPEFIGEDIKSWNAPYGVNAWRHAVIILEKKSEAYASFNLYINGTLLGSALCIFAERKIESQYFYMAMNNGSKLDNFVVSDTIDPPEPETTSTTTTTTPTPTPSPTPSETTTSSGIAPELLAVGIGVPVILVIVLVVWKVRK